MDRVLVTGATGFIGRHSLNSLIRQGYEVHGVHWGSAGTAPSGATTVPVGLTPEGTAASPKTPSVIWHEANLLDNSQTETLIEKIKPTHLLHFAWYVEHGKYLMSPENEKWVQAGTALIDSFIKNGGRRFVGAGTCFEYDWSSGYCSEKTTAIKPRGVYGEAKNRLHHYLQKQNSLESYSWGRIFFLYGPDEPPKRLVPAVAQALREGRPLPPTFTRRARDFMHVEDVGDAFAKLLDSKVDGPVNVASGQTHTLQEIVFTIADILGKPHPNLIEPAPNTTNEEPETLKADVTRLKKEVGWSPRYDLRQGLKKNLDSLFS